MSADNIGAKVGYVVLENDRLGEEWTETGDGLFTTISAAAGMIDTYEDRRNLSSEKKTYAIGRVELVMISRPDSEK